MKEVFARKWVTLGSLSLCLTLVGGCGGGGGSSTPEDQSSDGDQPTDQGTDDMPCEGEASLCECSAGVYGYKECVDGQHGDCQCENVGGLPGFCGTCHGVVGHPAPPPDMSDNTDITTVSVGLHEAHLAVADWHRQVECADCHVVPDAIDSPGHTDGSPAEVIFGQVAIADGASAAFDRTSAVCSDVYCHGGAMGTPPSTSFEWTDDQLQVGCVNCHGFPPASPHPSSSTCSECHGAVLNSSMAFMDASLHINGAVNVAGGCDTCHGYPPLPGDENYAGGGGAHEKHVTDESMSCDTCHGHNGSGAEHAAGGTSIDQANVDFAFTGDAVQDGATPAYDSASATCTGTYCHGGTLISGGSNTTPTWTGGTTEVACGSCHGAPMSGIHPASSTCEDCHSPVAGAGMTIADSTQHIDGNVTWSLGGACDDCHGNPPATAAHATHVTSEGYSCDTCHGHNGAGGTHAVGGIVVDQANIDFAFNNDAVLDGATPSYDTGTSTCSGTYCHGATLIVGGNNTSPDWTGGAPEVVCGTCHGTPPGAPHTTTNTCESCHSAVAGAGMTIMNDSLHVDGGVEIDAAACDACHGYPPTPGIEDYVGGGGAHVAHVTDEGYACNTCHGHNGTGPNHAEGAIVDPANIDIVYSGDAVFDGAGPSYDFGTARCSDTYCHGNTLLTAGSNMAPLWTGGAPEVVCGACHGAPMAAPHPASSACEDCHVPVAGAGMTINDDSLHVDLAVTWSMGGACDDCHGNPPSTGAHAVHVTSEGYTCDTCHGHNGTGGTHAVGGIMVDQANVNFVFGNDAVLDGATPSYDTGTALCSGTYCHGNTLLSAGSNMAPLWSGGSGEVVCGACHAAPMAAPHPTSNACEDCHAPVAGAGMTISDASLHVDGGVTWAMGGNCDDCHANPPTVATEDYAGGGGAHDLHVAIEGYTCDTCHGHNGSGGTHAVGGIVVDQANIDFAFNNDAVLDGATPSYDTGTSTCSGTYCHGATLIVGGSNTSPDWTGGAPEVVCGTCHETPPGTPHTTTSTCEHCHSAVAGAGMTIIDDSLHVDGGLEIDGAACDACHGYPPTPGIENYIGGGGAHVPHVTTEGYACDTCHGHNGTGPTHAEGGAIVDPANIDVVYSGDALFDGAGPSYDSGTASCSGTYCHGSTLLTPGSNMSPVWTGGAAEVVCGACHGAPMAAPHPTSNTCEDCHAPVAGAGMTINDASLHVDLTVTWGMGGNCDDCHGNPPTGATEDYVGGGGAHDLHVTTEGYTCDTCHGHNGSGASHAVGGIVVDQANIDFTFDNDAVLDGATPSYDTGTSLCAGTYCHGNTLLTAGSNMAPLWTGGSGEVVCGACHAAPMAAPHPTSGACEDCHAPVAGAGMTISDASLHVDGGVTWAMGGNCDDCHGNPPTGATEDYVGGGGAHDLHVTTEGYTCDTCHGHNGSGASHAVGGIVVDQANIDFTFNNDAVLDGATPSYDTGTSTCSGTYCHGATLIVGGSNTTPDWTGGAPEVVCGTCHETPPGAPHTTTSTCENCHSAVAGAGMTIIDDALHVDGGLEIDAAACDACHGYPPTPGIEDYVGGGGAHVAHVTTEGYACDTCHGHNGTGPTHAEGGAIVDPANIDVVYSGDALFDGAGPSYDSGTASCSGTYCHGSTLLTPGSNMSPVWTGGAAEVVCGACHGAPMAAPHPTSNTCEDCHAPVAGAGMTINDASLHVDLTVTWGMGGNCDDCHGNPPTGATEDYVGGGGAHDLHVTTEGYTCDTCHGHNGSGASHAVGGIVVDQANIDFTFNNDAVLDGATPSYDTGTSLCAGTYCHGNTLLTAGSNMAPLWTGGSGEVVCGACHGAPMADPHPTSTACEDCHAPVGAAGMTIGDASLHVDGGVTWAMGGNCDDCHGDPPTGATEDYAGGGGAHDLHVTTEGYTCDTCHGHNGSGASHAVGGIVVDQANVDFTFNNDAVLDGATPSYDTGTSLCAGTYCHGNTLLTAGSNMAPLWTGGSGEVVCGSCHAAPMAAPHPTSGACEDCHAPVAGAGMTISDASLHVDGGVTWAMGGNCDDCHANPPTGATEDYVGGGGAHDLHVTTEGYTCDTCHGHNGSGASHAVGGIVVDQANIDFTFNNDAVLDGATPSYDTGTSLCAGTYCHGNTLLTAGSNMTPLWTGGSGEVVCGACHAAPMAAPHPTSATCEDCHAPVAGAGMTISDASLHVDGGVTWAMGGNCDDCHGNPPTGATEDYVGGGGAHDLHVTTEGYTCDTCHGHDGSGASHAVGGIVVDQANINFIFNNDAVLGGATPSYDTGTAICSGTYCHGNTLLTAGSNMAPLWTGGSGEVVCGACHGAPMAGPHPTSNTCEDCHAPVAGAGMTINNAALHVDGGVTWAMGGACDDCHDNPPTPGTEDYAGGGGGHVTHVTTEGYACSTCHGHDGAGAGHAQGGFTVTDTNVDFTFAGDAVLDGATPSYNMGTATCSGNYCHGSTLVTAGSNMTPVWTGGAGEVVCGACHGAPMAGPHPTSNTCEDCHAPVAGAGMTINNAALHVDGGVTWAMGGACDDCHDNPPTPGTEDYAGGGGGHVTHVTTEGYACSTCHGHDGAGAGHAQGGFTVTDTNVDFTFGGDAVLDSAIPSYNMGAATCNGTYCHGSTLITAGSNMTPLWTGGAPEVVCGACHGAPMAGPHPTSAACEDCHAPVAGAGMTINDASQHVDGGITWAMGGSCTDCHDNPPTVGTQDYAGGGGAHVAHVTTEGYACSTCHGHNGSDPSHAEGGFTVTDTNVDFAFGGDAVLDAASPSYNLGAATCSGTYCHGTTLLTAGSNMTPDWTGGAAEVVCGACHGTPMAAPHPTSNACEECHSAVAGVGPVVIDDALHVDGLISWEVGPSCSDCHGNPPTAGTESYVGGGGAHTTHVATEGYACATCHGHDGSGGTHAQGGFAVTDTNVDFSFTGDALLDGALPSYSLAAAECSGSYCHGTTLLTVGTNPTPVWTGGAGEVVCGSCHATPMGAPHPTSNACEECHSLVASAGPIVTGDALHVDGSISWSVGPTCSDCHGNPPATGAHVNHATDRGYACSICHTHDGGAVASHAEGGYTLSDTDVDFAFGGLATAGGASPSYTLASATCTDTYCHGNTLVTGGLDMTPTWTGGAGEADCGDCHAVPMGSPHPTSNACLECHSQVAGAGPTVIDDSKHPDGSISWEVGPTCTDCHGNPPLPGSQEYAGGGGAHDLHVNDRSYGCSTCHGHDGDTDPSHAEGGMNVLRANVDVVFTDDAIWDTATADYDTDNAMCDGVYCHGGTLDGGFNTSPVWTGDTDETACGSCHSTPPGGSHVASTDCAACHSAVVEIDTDTSIPDTDTRQMFVIVDTDLHINTNLDKDAGACGGCHDTPPSMGAHVFHVNLDNVNCDTCHGHMGEAGHDVSADSDSAADIEFDTSFEFYVGGTRLEETISVTFVSAGASSQCQVGCHNPKVGDVENLDNIAVWNDTSISCADCHEQPGLISPANHPIDTTDDASIRAGCQVCHSVANHRLGTSEILDPDTDDLFEYDTDAPEGLCQTCHDGNTISYFNGALPMNANSFWLSSEHGTTQAMTCMDCHGIHQGQGRSNLRATEEETLCAQAGCHSAKLAEMTDTVTTPHHHDVVDTDPDGGFLECTSCHNPHNATVAQPVSNPDSWMLMSPADTPDEYLEVDSGASVEDDTQTFCLACHDGTWAGAIDVASALADKVATTGFRTGNGPSYTSKHESHQDDPNTTSMACTYCHNAHASTGNSGAAPRGSLLYDWLVVATYPYKKNDCSMSNAGTGSVCH